MYAHEVLADLMNNKVFPVEEEKFQIYIHYIQKAIKFHFGNIENVDKYVKGKELFGPGIRGFPYENIWVDMYWEKERVKAAMLILAHNSTIAIAKSFMYACDTGKFWGHSKGCFIIMIGGGTPENQGVLKERYPTLYRPNGSYESNVIFAQPEDNQYQDEWVQAEQSIISMVDKCLVLLSCKNIIQETIKPPAKLNKKRIKSNKPPIYEYRVLRMVVPRSVKQSNSDTAAKGLYTLPVHVCIGHEKTYTAERPLFGKHVGKYWWQPQERGNKKNGVIEKEYNIEVRI